MLLQIFTGASILGAVCVSAGHAGAANLVWSISNPALSIHNWKQGDIHQARMFGVFGFLAILGVLGSVL